MPARQWAFLIATFAAASVLPTTFGTLHLFAGGDGDGGGGGVTAGAGATVIETAATFESALPSPALNVKVSLPEYVLVGVYVTDPEAIVPRVPCPGGATIDSVSGSPSLSVHVSVIAVGVAFGTLFVPSMQVGG